MGWVGHEVFSILSQGCAPSESVHAEGGVGEKKDGRRPPAVLRSPESGSSRNHPPPGLGRRARRLLFLKHPLDMLCFLALGVCSVRVTELSFCRTLPSFALDPDTIRFYHVRVRCATCGVKSWMYVEVPRLDVFRRGNIRTQRHMWLPWLVRRGRSQARVRLR